MSGSKKTTKVMKVDDLARAIRLFVVLQLDDATDRHAVLGPVLWRPRADNPAGKNWYSHLATCGAGGFRRHQRRPGMIRISQTRRALAMMVLIERPPLVVHDTDDEVQMARLCETLWPGKRISALRAAVEREYAAP